MALPVNKPTLDSKIATDLGNNSTQAITAQVLRNTLNPIVNSTFGLKTIWAGRLYLSFDREGRKDYRYFENYYDPNYFPTVQDPGGALVLNSIFNKYQVTNLGSSLRVDGLSSGTFTNIPATLASTNTGDARQGGGLTFDGTIASGVLTSLSVNNPGIAYADGYLTNTALELQLGITAGGVLPKLKFNLQNTIWVANNSETVSENTWDRGVSNIFVPSIANVFPMAPHVDRSVTGLVLSYTDIYGSEKTAALSHSRISRGYSNSTTVYTTGGEIQPNKPGFYITQAIPSLGAVAGDTFGFGDIEIKVPITNTTI